MTATAQMLETYPAEINLDRARLARVIDTLRDCVQVCTACADACLSEPAGELPKLTRCIRDNLDCADICGATVAVLSRHTGYDANLTRAQVLAAVLATQTCGDSCAEHSNTHEHCRICAHACREAEKALNDLLPQLTSSGPTAGARPSQSAPQRT